MTVIIESPAEVEVKSADRRTLEIAKEILEDECRVVDDPRREYAVDTNGDILGSHEIDQGCRFCFAGAVAYASWIVLGTTPLSIDDVPVALLIHQKIRDDYSTLDLDEAEEAYGEGPIASMTYVLVDHGREECIGVIDSVLGEIG